MNAPVLHPTARMRPVLLERLERQGVDHCLAALGLAALAVYLRVDSVQVTWSAAVACVLLCGALLPGLQAIGPGDRVWDATLPVDRASHSRIRLACGLVGAAFLLAVVVVLYALLFGNPGEPGWYPLALFAWGLTAHLLGSAVLLGAGTPTGLLVLPVLCALLVALVPASLEEPAELGRMGVTAVLARTALLPALAGAAAYVAAGLPGRAPRTAGPAQHARAPRRDLADATVARPAPRPIRRAGPARPSAARIVFRRHFVLLRRFTLIPALIVLCVALAVLIQWNVWPEEMGEGRTVRSFVEPTGLREWCWWLALSWAGLVWLGEQGPRRQWNDTLPVGRAKRRILHAAAGVAWLLLFLTVVVAAPLVGAAAAGMLGSPADIPAWLWLGLPCATLTQYLVLTFFAYGVHVAFEAAPSLVPRVIVRALPARTPGMFVVLIAVIGALGVPLGLLMLGIDFLEGQSLDVGAGAGNVAASALLLVLSAAAAGGAIVTSDWIRHLDRLPTLREVRGFLHEWAGARRGPPLHGHAGR